MISEFFSFFTPMIITLIILFTASFFFMQGKVRSDFIAICALLSLVLTGVLSPTQALSGFSNSVVIMMAGLFVVGAGILRTGLAKLISSRILKLAGKSESKLFILVILVTGFIGAFVSNTGTVAVMMPIVVGIAMSANISPRRFLMPLAFASSMGGMLTLIGTPPNLIASQTLQDNGFEPLGFFQFTPIGIITISIGVVALFFLSKIFLSKDRNVETGNKGKSLSDLVDEYSLQDAYKVFVPVNSDLVAKTLKDLSVTTLYNISIVTVEKSVVTARFRKSVEEIVAIATTEVDANDVLVCYGKKEDIERFVTENSLDLLDYTHKKNVFNFEDIGIAEVFIMPNSKLINRTVAETHFRDEFNVNILGVKTKAEYKMHDLQNEKLHSGDALLIQGNWKDIANLGDRQDDLVLVGQPLKEAEKVTIDKKAPLAALIMILMVVIMVFNIMPPVIAVLIAAGLMIATGCLRNMEEAYKSINWGSVMLLAGMMPMALAFEETGIAQAISETLVGRLGHLGPYALLAGIYFGTSLLTMFISNSATALLFAPIGMQAALEMSVSPYPFMFAVAVAASMCFASPFSTSPNAMVMTAGRYSFFDYIKVGLPLQILMGVVMILVLPLLFPFTK